MTNALAQALMLALGFGIGLIMSALFFAGLAWGMKKALASKQPALWLLASFILRASLLLGAGILAFSQSQDIWLLAGYLIAFFVVRLLSTKLTKAKLEASHAAHS